MATKFSKIREYIRAALLDHDSSHFQYSDQALNQQIRFQLLNYEDATVIEADAPPETFSNELTNLQKLVLSLKIAIRLLSGQSGTFSYRSPVLSVSRSDFKYDLLSNLETMLDDTEGGKFAITVDTDFDAIVNGFNRYITSFDSAYSKL